MKHAFLITAFRSFDNLNRILELLDDEKSLIFLHIDAQVSIPNSIYSPRKAQLYVLPQQCMYWASPREVYVVLDMIEYALNYDWDYCHYITENDLPLKSVNEINSIFEKANGSEFIDYAPENYSFAQYKCNVFHFFTNFKCYRATKALRIFNLGLAKVQLSCGIRRFRKEFKHGSAYFSITRSFCSYLTQHKKEIKHDYRYTLCAIEVWLQTICMHSPFRSQIANYEQLHYGNLRYIDWARRNGNSPYTFQTHDFDHLVDLIENSSLCFARKFDQNAEVTAKIYEYLKARSATITPDKDVVQ